MTKEPDLIVGNAPPRLDPGAARAIAAAAQEHGFDVPPIAQAAIDADDAAQPKSASKAATSSPASAGRAA